MNKNIIIRPAEKKDEDRIWKIIKAVIATGDTYVFAPDSPKDQMMDFWFGPEKHTYVATIDEKVSCQKSGNFKAK